MKHLSQWRTGIFGLTLFLFLIAILAFFRPNNSVGLAFLFKGDAALIDEGEISIFTPTPSVNTPLSDSNGLPTNEELPEIFDSNIASPTSTTLPVLAPSIIPRTDQIATSETLSFSNGPQISLDDCTNPACTPKNQPCGDGGEICQGGSYCVAGRCLEMSIEQLKLANSPVSQRWIVEFKKPPIKKYLSEIKNSNENAGTMALASNSILEKNYGLQLETENGLFKKQLEGVGVKVNSNYKVAFNGLSFEGQLPSEIASDPSVKRIIRDYPVFLTLYDSVPQINANSVWDISDASDNKITGKGIKIAIIDSGVDYSHPDLGGCFGSGCKVIGGYDFFNKDANPMDDNGHGTHVASIASGNGAIKGVAPDASIIAYKAISNKGTGYASDIIASIEAAMDPNGDLDFSDRADIISMSLGTISSPDDPISKASEVAVDSGIVVIAAAGNTGFSGPYTLNAPGNAKKVISVGASCKRSQLGKDVYCSNSIVKFSSQGPTSYGFNKPDIVAPGHLICAAKLSGFKPENSNYRDCFDSSHILLSGTSMATPHVSGVAALLKQAHPEWTSEEIKSTLKGSSNYFPLISYHSQGSGEVDTKAAVLSAAPYPIAELNTRAIFIDGLLEIRGSANGRNFESYTLEYGEGFDPISWSNIAISILPQTDAILGSFDTSLVSSKEFSIRLTVTDAFGRKTYDWENFLKKDPNWLEGFPIQVKTDTIQLWFAPAIADLDGDGSKEIIFGIPSNEGSFVYVWDSKGKIKPGWPRQVNLGGGSTPAIGDIDGDGELEIVYKSTTFLDQKIGKTTVFAWNLDGTSLPGWPKNLPFYEYLSIESLSLFDLNSDGKDEIFVGNVNSGLVFDYLGNSIPGDWEKEMINVFRMGDLDGDKKSEIIGIERNSGLINIFDTSGKKLSSNIGHYAGSMDKTYIYDIDLDGRDEIVDTELGVWEYSPGVIGSPTRISVYRGIPGSIFLDGLPYLIGIYQDKVGALSGVSYPKYSPISLGGTSLRSKNAVGSFPTSFISPTYGFVLALSDYYSGEFSLFSTKSKSEIKKFDTLSHSSLGKISKQIANNGAAIGDIDGDGNLDYLSAYFTSDLLNQIDTNLGTYIIATDMGIPGTPYWPTFMGNNARTGKISNIDLPSDFLCGDLDLDQIAFSSKDFDKLIQALSSPRPKYIRSADLDFSLSIDFQDRLLWEKYFLGNDAIPEPISSIRPKSLGYPSPSVFPIIKKPDCKTLRLLDEQYSSEITAKQTPAPGSALYYDVSISLANSIPASGYYAVLDPIVENFELISIQKTPRSEGLDLRTIGSSGSLGILLDGSVKKSAIPKGSGEIAKARFLIPPGKLIVCYYSICYPSGADVYLNGVKTGNAPLSIPIGRGAYTLEIKKYGFLPFVQKFFSPGFGVAQNFDYNLKLNLSEPVNGTANFSSSPQGALISIMKANSSEQYYPVGISPTKKISLEPGSYFARAEKSGFVTLERSFFIKPDSNTQVNLQLGAVSPSPTIPPIEIRISSMDCRNITNNSIVIHWLTNINADSRVEYWSNPSNKSNVSSKDLEIWHELKLTNLTPKTYYNFIAYSCDNRSCASAGPYSCMTNSQNPSPSPTMTPIVNLTIKTIPSGASAYVESIYRGLTPVFISAINSGKKLLFLDLAGFDPVYQYITVANNSNIFEYILNSSNSNSTLNSTCTDFDGRNYFQTGQTYGIANGTAYNFTDMCHYNSGNQTLEEFYCNGQFWTSEFVNCSSFNQPVCLDGRCVSANLSQSSGFMDYDRFQASIAQFGYGIFTTSLTDPLDVFAAPKMISTSIWTSDLNHLSRTYLSFCGSSPPGKCTDFKYCDNGRILDDCSLCGCPTGKVCKKVSGTPTCILTSSPTPFPVASPIRSS